LHYFSGLGILNFLFFRPFVIYQLNVISKLCLAILKLLSGLRACALIVIFLSHFKRRNPFYFLSFSYKICSCYLNRLNFVSCTSILMTIWFVFFFGWNFFFFLKCRSKWEFDSKIGFSGLIFFPQLKFCKISNCNFRTESSPKNWIFLISEQKTISEFWCWSAWFSHSEEKFCLIFCTNLIKQIVPFFNICLSVCLIWIGVANLNPVLYFQNEFFCFLLKLIFIPMFFSCYSVYDAVIIMSH